MAVAQFSGLASGIDTKALIDAIVEARELTNKSRRASIEHMKSEDSALSELKKKMIGLSDLLDSFRSANGTGLVKKATSSDTAVATAVAGSNANNAAYSVTVQTLANPGTASFNQTYSSLDQAVSTAGSGYVSVLVGNGADQVHLSVSVTQNTTTVNDLVEELNANPAAAGRFVASTVNVGTASNPSYKIVFNSLEAGEAKGEISLFADAALTELQGNTIQPASNAVFRVAGIAGDITRTSNVVSDVIPGVTFELLKGGTTTVSVATDVDATSDKLSEFVDLYNELVRYSQENNQIRQDNSSADGKNIYGSLAKTRVDNDFLSRIRADLFSATSKNGTSARSMSELGLSTNRDGTLTFDAAKFKSAAGADPTGVSEVVQSFADITSGVTGSIYEFTRFQGVVDLAMSANEEEITNLNAAIDKVERQSQKIRESLTLRYARFESLTARMQQSQSALSGILAGL